MYCKSNLTVVIKSHGSTIDGTSLGYIPSIKGISRSNGRTEDEMVNTNKNGILLIRNPYRAIYGYRHLMEGGHVGYADASKFFGPGMKCIRSNAFQNIANKINLNIKKYFHK